MSNKQTKEQQAIVRQIRRDGMIQSARTRVDLEWGASFKLLGARIQRALLAEAILDIAAAQDDDEVGDEAVRRIVTDGHDWVIDWVVAHGGPLA